MLCEIMIIETAPNGDSFFNSIALVGQPQTIAKEIAAQNGDLDALCLEGQLANYTLVTVFMDNTGRVWTS